MSAKNTSTIVVVDNSPAMRVLFERATENLAVELMVFDSSSASWSYLKENRPDLLFLNIKMPDKDGLSFLKELRQLPLHADTAVVMISSKDYAQDRSIASELGALQFITKPTPIRVITEVLLDHLNLEKT